MGMFQKNTNRHSLMSEINVTPFVDVMLVLLIIFMVTAPLLQQNLKISLPQTKATGGKITKDPLTLKISKEKKLYIGSQPIKLTELSKKLKAILKHKSERAVYLKADKNTPYGFVAKALTEIKSSGIQSINLITTIQ